MKQTMRIGVVLLGALTVAMWFGMSSVNKTKDAVAQQMEQLEKRALQKELVFEEMVGMIDDVESQIDEILKRENLIVDQRKERFSADQKIKLITELQMIDQLILNSASNIQRLNDKVRSSELRLGVFQKKINGLQADLKNRAEQVVDLKTALAAKDQALAFLMDQKDSLTTQISAYVETIDKKEFQIDQLQAANTELYKGYMVIGTYDELKAKGVVDKEGGFLGFLGRKMAIKEDAELGEFMSVDKRNVNRLRIEAKNLSLVSEHPSDSYQILPGETESMRVLEITDPNAFWQISQYLVISKRT